MRVVTYIFLAAALVLQTSVAFPQANTPELAVFRRDQNRCAPPDERFKWFTYDESETCGWSDWCDWACVTMMMARGSTCPQYYAAQDLSDIMHVLNRTNKPLSFDCRRFSRYAVAAQAKKNGPDDVSKAGMWTASWVRGEPTQVKSPNILQQWFHAIQYLQDIYERGGFQTLSGTMYFMSDVGYVQVDASC